jgi:hypothetical protein
MWLLHGTTQARAERILQRGPDVRFVEPDGVRIAENFSFTVEGSPSAMGDSLTYARGKAVAFPTERGPVIVAVDVPEEIVRLAATEHLSLFAGLIVYNPNAVISELIDLCGGAIQFDPGPALENLLLVWAELAKEIRGVP